MELNTLTAVKEMVDQELAIMIYFYNDNCAPCKALRPKVKELVEEKFPQLKLVFVNGSAQEITANFQVYDYPTLLVYFDKKEYIRESKYVSMQQLEQQIDRYYSMLF